MRDVSSIINVRKSRFVIYRNVSVHWNSKSDAVIYFCRINQSFARTGMIQNHRNFFIFSRLVYFLYVSKLRDLLIEKIYNKSISVAELLAEKSLGSQA